MQLFKLPRQKPGSKFHLIFAVSICFILLEAPIPARAAQPAPLFFSPTSGASVTDGKDLTFSVAPVTGAGGFGGGYLWAIGQGTNEIWENWRDAHTLDGPTWTLPKGSPGYNAIPKNAWVSVAVRALVNGEWTNQGTIIVFVAQELVYHSIQATLPSSHYFGKVKGLNFNATNLAEPDAFEYRNYCGPSATRALLSVWAPLDPSAVIPTLKDIGTQEDLKENAGISYTHCLLKGINQNIGVNKAFYRIIHPGVSPHPGALPSLGPLGTGGIFEDPNEPKDCNPKLPSDLFQPNTPNDLADAIGFSIYDVGVPVIVGLKTALSGSSTSGLNGWCPNSHCYTGKDGKPPPHIVMVYGFNFQSANNATIQYFEPAGQISGCGDPTYCGGKKNTIGFFDLYYLMQDNNFIVAGYPDVCPGPKCVAR